MPIIITRSCRTFISILFIRAISNFHLCISTFLTLKLSRIVPPLRYLVLYNVLLIVLCYSPSQTSLLSFYSHFISPLLYFLTWNFCLIFLLRFLKLKFDSKVLKIRFNLSFRHLILTIIPVLYWNWEWLMCHGFQFLWLLLMTSLDSVCLTFWVIIS